MSLFGIFNFYLQVLYGESAENALGHLPTKIISQSWDISVLDWVGKASPFHSCFPARITSCEASPSPPSHPNAAPMTTQRPTSLTSLRKLRGSLIRVPLPQFFNRRLVLPYISHRVTGVQLTGHDPSVRSYTYTIQASGLRPLEIVLPDKLGNATRSQGARQFVRPWHLKSQSTKVDAASEEQLLLALATPFNALLLTELSHSEYKMDCVFYSYYCFTRGLRQRLAKQN